MEELTKNELNERLFNELTPTQLGLINFNIYYNKDYIDYYIDYNCGEYNKCYEFIMENLELLDIKYTPKKWKNIAKKQLGIK
jgi:hypothetical protein